jgi:hypothetical protein
VAAICRIWSRTPERLAAHAPVETNHCEIAQAMSGAPEREVHYEPATIQYLIEDEQLNGSHL